MFDVLNRINELRESRGWSVYKLSKLSGIPQSTIATWYKKNLCPPIDKIELLCHTFQIPLTEFFYPASEAPSELDDFISKWTLLDPEQRQAILRIIDLFLVNGSDTMKSK